MAKYNLPDITFAEKDAQVIENEMIKGYEEAAEQVLANGDPRKKLIQSEVPIITGQRALIDFSAKQNMLAYTEDEYLDHFGVLVGTPRLQEAAATTTERFILSVIRTQPTIIEMGKRVTAGDGIFFAVEEETIIPSGQMSVDVRVKCTEVGTKGNGYAQGTITTLVDLIPYIANVINITESEGGADREGPDTYRDRIQQAPERFSTAGPDGAYIYWAKTASTSIIDVKPYSPSPGVVHVCVLLASGEIPGQEILDKVLAACSSKKVRPLTDHVFAVAPEVVPYALNVQYWIDKSNESMAASIRTAVDKAVVEYQLWQRSALGRDIDTTELVYLMRAAGAKRVLVHSPMFLALEDNQVAREEEPNVISYEGTES
jgi:phage-related baseplate assembly protein